MKVPDPSEQPLLKMTEVAELLDVCLANAYRMVRDGTLPVVYLGGKKSSRVRTADFRAFLGLDHEGDE